MQRLNEKGQLNGLLVPLILAILLLIAAGFYGYSLYNQTQHYKNDSDKIVATAVKKAKADQTTADGVKFAEESKSPLRTYNGPSDLGSVRVQYPKTWSLYVNQGDNSTPLDGYGYPNFVPGDNTTSYALRFQVINTSYDQEVQNFQDNAQAGKVRVSAYQPVNIKGVVGVRVTGQIEDQKVGDMIILPLRSQTFEIWTESDKFENDFNNYILPNFSFAP